MWGLETCERLRRKGRLVRHTRLSRMPRSQGCSHEGRQGRGSRGEGLASLSQVGCSRGRGPVWPRGSSPHCRPALPGGGERGLTAPPGLPPRGAGGSVWAEDIAAAPAAGPAWAHPQLCSPGRAGESRGQRGARPRPPGPRAAPHGVSAPTLSLLLSAGQEARLPWGLLPWGRARALCAPCCGADPFACPRRQLSPNWGALGIPRPLPWGGAPTGAGSLCLGGSQGSGAHEARRGPRGWSGGCRVCPERRPRLLGPSGRASWRKEPSGTSAVGSWGSGLGRRS